MSRCEMFLGAISCSGRQTGCSMLPGEAVHTDLTCSAIEKRDHMVVKLDFLFSLGAQWEIKSAPYFVFFSLFL